MITTFPENDGFYMPAEFSAHEGTIMIWPVRPGSWGKDASAAQRAFLNVISAVSRDENVYLLADKKHIASAKNAVTGIKNVDVMEIPSDDAWARDVCPTFLINGMGDVRGVNWSFNAWGGTFDGLYADWRLDNEVAEKFCRAIKKECYDASSFVLEGGSIHSDGEGTIMVTEACLLSGGRNPSLSKSEIEEKLRLYLGAKKILWLPRGIYNDETNEHVDNICAFIAPGKVVLAWTDNENDPQYPLSHATFEYLEGERDAAGRKLIIHKLPIPDVPIVCSQSDVDAYEFEPGEDIREAGERLAASYVNFYFTNGSVIVPQFGGENKSSDRRALEILEKICEGRRIVPIYARDILQGGGNIHCITQQIPKGV
ncbi:MAG: agmatine deiminase [Eubacteriales bacterium]